MSEGIGGEIPQNIEIRSPESHDRDQRFRKELEKGNPLVTGRWGAFCASAPEGFIIQTEEVQGRLEGFAIKDFANKNIFRRLFKMPKRSKGFTYPARKNVVEANQREVGFHQALEYEEAKRKGREPEIFNIDEVSGDPKAVIRGWRVEDVVDPDTQETRKVLKFIISGNSYAGYRLMSGVNADVAEKALGNILGVAMGIVTNDGYIIMQKRGKNATYGDDIDADPGRGIPGASAAGTLDAKIPENPQASIKARAEATGKKISQIGTMIEPIDTDYITRFMYTEAHQEDGLNKNEIDIIPTVLYDDLLSPHKEIGMTGKTTLNALDFLRRAAENQEVNRGRHHFAERVMVLTPEELEKMFTEVEVPWPSTHALTMMGTLQQAYIQRGMSPEDAQAKLLEIQTKWYEVNKRINKRVRQYYDELPEALIRNRQRASDISDLGYDPRVFAGDQGIRPLDVEMREAGIGDTTERFLREAGLITT